LTYETNNEALKSKMKSLKEETDRALEVGITNASLSAFKTKITEIIEMQLESEKSMMDHDLALADSSKRSSCADEDESFGDDQDGDEARAAHVLKHNVLNTELQNLKKALVQKEKLATAMFANDEKLQEMKKKYEESLTKLESEMVSLQKERDGLAQQHRSSESSNKIAENRRKRIQELEQQINELRKKMVEQQRAIKINEKNEQQVKKLAEEIRQMKQTKVRLIKQIREEADRMRDWKQQKEREVIRLKQNERKQQVKMAKMETLHSKQQIVLRRKMEEAVVAHKRLKEVIEKQKAARASKAAAGPAADSEKPSLAGAGERIRGWINEELEVVSGVRAAEHSRDLLINDRKLLGKQLEDMKRKMRETMGGQEMEDVQNKMEELTRDLELRSAQIDNLQKQISDLESVGGSAGPGAASSARGRFESVKSITESKIALEHVFEKFVEQSVGAGQMKSELDDLRQLYAEAVHNTVNLEKEISALKNEYQSDFTRQSRDYEEKMLFLIEKAFSQPGAEGSPDFQNIREELSRFSQIHVELRKLTEENELLRQQQAQGTRTGKPSAANVLLDTTVTKKAKKTPPVVNDQLADDSMETSMEEDDESEGEEEGDDNLSDDPDWHKTPLFQRIKKLRQTSQQSAAVDGAGGAAAAPQRKRKAAATSDSADEASAVKRSSSGSRAGCGCKTQCSRRTCFCKKAGSHCADDCKCDPAKCVNKADRSVLGDVSNDTASTASLLSATFTTSVLKENEAPTVPSSAEASPGSPYRIRRAATTTHFFKSPLAE
jgi:kinesin family protein 4/21/27